jgi:hypothetical protein
MGWRCVAAFAAVLALGGCGTPEMVGMHAIATTDRFSKDIEINGPAVFVNPLGGITREWHLRSFVAKDTHAVVDQLYVDIDYNPFVREWKFFYRAADEDAEDLPVVVIDRSIPCRGCSFFETIGVMLDDATLRAHAATGYQVKIWSRRGDALVLSIAPHMITEQIAVIDQYVHPALLGPGQPAPGDADRATLGVTHPTAGA